MQSAGFDGRRVAGCLMKRLSFIVVPQQTIAPSHSAGGLDVNNVSYPNHDCQAI